ncbi:Non-specific lipid-transfer protein 2 [Apostasia shenzhenica]|uniref:Non-specific lipid-transfer protein 2 n=1 Tax=Apostasia shenzhenica TaxID=1088818 RepID=A0A2I0AUB7_9ASPA|nr:Non-specific lipid-transfer protein 2 [Apostasia shenzhenica]
MKPVLILFTFIPLLLLSRATADSAPADCDPLQLLSCSNSIFSGSRPTDECCGRLREQQPCFCQYMRDPILRSYVNSTNAQKIAVACSVPFPRC